MAIKTALRRQPTTTTNTANHAPTSDATTAAKADAKADMARTTKPKTTKSATPKDVPSPVRTRELVQKYAGFLSYDLTSVLNKKQLLQVEQFRTLDLDDPMSFASQYFVHYEGLPTRSLGHILEMHRKGIEHFGGEGQLDLEPASLKQLWNDTKNKMGAGLLNVGKFLEPAKLNESIDWGYLTSGRHRIATGHTWLLYLYPDDDRIYEQQIPLLVSSEDDDLVVTLMVAANTTRTQRRHELNAAALRLVHLTDDPLTLAADSTAVSANRNRALSSYLADRLAEATREYRTEFYESYSELQSDYISTDDAVVKADIKQEMDKHGYKRLDIQPLTHTIVADQLLKQLGFWFQANGKLIKVDDDTPAELWDDEQEEKFLQWTEAIVTVYPDTLVQWSRNTIARDSKLIAANIIDRLQS